MSKHISVAGKGLRCQEASPLSTASYIPCGQPAEFIVQSKDTDAYVMCSACANHNTRNRSARYVMEGDTYTLYNGGKLPAPFDNGAPSLTDTPAATRTVPTIAEIIKKKLELKDKLEKLSKQFADFTKEDNEAMAGCDQIILMMLNAAGTDSVKTEFGTAYKSTVVSAGVDPDGGWEKLMAFVFQDVLQKAVTQVENDDGEVTPETLSFIMQSPALSFFVRNVNKTAVMEFSEQNAGALPPGIKTTSITRANVRRS